MWNNWTASTAKVPSIDEMLAMTRKLEAKKNLAEAEARFDFVCNPCQQCGHKMELSSDGGTVKVCEHRLNSFRKLPKLDSLASNTYLPSVYGIKVELVASTSQANNEGKR